MCHIKKLDIGNNYISLCGNHQRLCALINPDWFINIKEQNISNLEFLQTIFNGNLMEI